MISESPPSAVRTASPRRLSGRWWPLATVCMGTLMLLIDVTIVNVALPDMAADLHTSFAALQWVVDVYALALAALVLGAGSLADLFGQRRVYVVGLFVFALASLASGLAPNPEVLIAARAVQGIGAAAMFATTFALLNASYQGRDRGTAYGIWGSVAGASAALGPIAGGVLTQGLSWRWIFFVNLPISAVAIGLCMVVLAADRPTRGTKVDVVGMATFSLAAGGLTFGLIRGNEDGWGTPLAVGSLVLSVLSLVAFVVVERRRPHAMMDLELLRNRPFVMTLVTAAVINLSAFAYLAYSSLWLQSVLGYGPIKAAFVGSVPLAIASLLVSPFSDRLVQRWSAGKAMAFGTALIGVGAIVAAIWLISDQDWPALIIGLVIAGIGVGISIPVMSSTAMMFVPVQRSGMAAGMVSTSRQLGFAIGIAVLGSVFAARIATVLGEHGLRPIASAVSAGQTPRVIGAASADQKSELLDHINRATASGVGLTLWVSGIVALACAGLAWLWIRAPRIAPPAALVGTGHVGVSET